MMQDFSLNGLDILAKLARALDEKPSSSSLAKLISWCVETSMK
jgi:hypothetical protein